MMRRLSILLTVGVFSLAVLGAASAAAVQPWWHLSMGARPSLLHVARDDVQEITTPDGAEGPFVLAFVRVEGVQVACLTSEVLATEHKKEAESICGGAELDWNAAQLEVSLNKHYGAGTVEVTGKSGGEGKVGSEPGEPMIVTAHGREVAPIRVERWYEFRGEFSSRVISEGGSGKLVLVAYNLGDAPTSGPVTLTDVLPAGLTATGVIGSAGRTNGAFVEELVDPRVKCVVATGTRVSCTFEGVLEPYERLEAVVWVIRGESAVSGEANVVGVSGGGARGALLSREVFYGEGPAPFGVEPGSYEVEPEEEGGTPDVQAGSHPYQLTTTMRMNESEEVPWQPAQPRNLRFDLPAGLVGDAQATPQCTYAQFTTSRLVANSSANACPADTAVGVSMQELVLGRAKFAAIAVPVFNLTPVRGEPARFGFVIGEVQVILDTSVRTGSDYGVRVSVHNLSELAATVISSVVSIWGVPGDPRHDTARGWACLFEGQQPGCGSSLSSRLPLLSMPSACEAFQAPTQVQSWKPGAELLPPVESMFEATLDGCNQLPFGADIEAAPDVQSASTPSGLTVHVHVPQEAALNSAGLTDADVRDTTVALPPGVTLNPGAAAKLEACSEAQIGFEGKDASDPALQLFTSSLPSPFCPDGAKIATVRITTPLLPNPLEGAVYQASPAPDGEGGQNPFDSLVALYLVAEDPVSGTLVKLPGQVVPCEQAGEVFAGVTCQAAGQLISSFEDTPQLPFEDLEVHFFGGEKAPLATPALCGAYTTQASFTPWSGGAPVRSTSTFQITSGPHGGSCPSSPLPFKPEFVAEMTNVQAGGFSELRTTMGHRDGDQALNALSVKMPPGLSGVLSGVKLCGEPQANEGTCGPGSLIGHTVVTAGLGSSPVVVKRPGGVYLTGPFNGHGACRVGEPGCAPFGLSIANPAEAGPFDLEKGTACDCVVVRAKVEVDPVTAQLRVVSGSLPTILKGVPLDLQHVQVAIDRPGFAFNPTSCDRMRIEGSMSGSEGANVPVSTPFQVTDCAALGFKPSFKVATSARTSKRNGASLRARISFPKGSFGRQANIRMVRVELPRRLPSRLSTLQKACFVSVFEKNPADCPASSRVGYARAVTPIVPVPLTGPAYFVSHGGAKFPELVIVLQGYGITIDLHGETFINERTEITTSTFKTAPDQPISSFELSLPEGRYSALAANGSLCVKTVKRGGREVKRRVKLVMPTTIVAQDGAVIHQHTKIAVTGCKAARKGRNARGRRHHRRRG
jgi:hypothetical protein